MDDVDPIEEVFAERALCDHGAQVTIRGCDDANLDPGVTAIGTDFLKLARFEEAEQQSLHPQAHLAHFIEKHGSAAGHLELARLVTVGAGEAPPDVTKQLGFEKRLRNTSAVEGDERSMRRGTPPMNHLGHDILPRPRFHR